MPLLHGRVEINLSDLILRHHGLFSIFGVAGLFKSIGGILACLVDEDNGTTWMLVGVTSDIVDLVINDNPHVLFGVVLTDLFPSVQVISHS